MSGIAGPSSSPAGTCTLPPAAPLIPSSRHSVQALLPTPEPHHSTAPCPAALPCPTCSSMGALSTPLVGPAGAGAAPLVLAVRARLAEPMRWAWAACAGIARCARYCREGRQEGWGPV